MRWTIKAFSASHWIAAIVPAKTLRQIIATQSKSRESKNDDFIWHFMIGFRLHSTTWCESKFISQRKLFFSNDATTKAVDDTSSFVICFLGRERICVCLASAPLVCLHVVNVYANVHQVYLSHMWQRNEKKSLICADGTKEERRRWKMERFLFGEWEEEKSLSELLWWTERNIVRLQNELWAADGAESAPLNKLWNDEQAEGERKGFCWCISPSSLRMK